MKKILVIMMSLVMVFAMTACGGSGETLDEDLPEITVTLNIDFPDGSDLTDIEDSNVKGPKGSTVYEILAAYCSNNDIEVYIEESGGIDCITNIGGVVQTDSMGWVYQINGKDVMDTATECIVNDGDVIAWKTQEW